MGDAAAALMCTRGSARQEQSLLEQRLRDGVAQPEVLVWSYSTPTLLPGRGQHLDAAQRLRAERVGLDVLARSSGGGAVLADQRLLSVTLLLPTTHALAITSLPGSYRTVGEICRRALTSIGLEARLAAPPARVTGAQRDPLDWICFAGLGHGELVDGDGRKLLGLAQVRRSGGIAICIGLQRETADWSRLLQVWHGRVAPALLEELRRRATSCAELAPNSAQAVPDALVGAIAARWLDSQGCAA